MKRRILEGLIVVLTIVMAGCSKPVEDPGPAPLPSAYTKLYLKFTQNVNGVNLNTQDSIIYENLPGNIYSVKDLKYLISNVRLNNFLYENYEIDEYFLVDTKDQQSLTVAVTDSIKFGDYASISLFVGFLEEENTTGAHTDLDNHDCNCWQWNPSRGGGYYTLRMSGRFYENSFDVIPDPYDIGVGANKLVVTQTDSSYKANEIIASIKNSGFTIPRGTKAVTLEIQLNVNKLFESANGTPNFNLVNFSTGLEDNAAGTAIISGNLTTAFKLGGITYGPPK